MRERWKEVFGYEGLYEISDQGRVRSLARLVIRTNWYGTQQFVKPGQFLKPGFSKGYPKVTLCVDGQQKQFWVHRLVAIAFIGPEPFDGAFVLHKDDNPANCYYKNLRWGTAAENSHDMMLKNRQCRGSDINTALLTARDVRRIVKLTQKGMSSQEIAQSFPVSRHTINDIRKGRSWTHVTGFARG